MKVLLDSNFLIDLIKFRIEPEEMRDLITEKIQFFTLDLVVRELKKISQSKSKYSRHAKLALKLIKLKGVKILKSKKLSVDDAIVSFANRDFIVATNDKILRERLKKVGIKTIYLRARKHLAIG